jgi:hypothetical protein
MVVEAGKKIIKDKTFTIAEFKKGIAAALAKYLNPTSSAEEQKGFAKKILDELGTGTDVKTISDKIIALVIAKVKSDGILNLSPRKIISLSALEQFAASKGIVIDPTSGNFNSSNPTVKKEAQDDKIKKYLNIFAKKQLVDIIGYKDYVNKYGLLITYLAIAITLVPIAYIILKKQNFR